MGKRLEMNAFMLFIAIVFWTWLWGAVGAMLAVPLTLICMTLYSGLMPQTKIQPICRAERLSRLRHAQAYAPLERQAVHA